MGVPLPTSFRYMLGFSLLILLAGFCDIDMPVYLLCSLVGLCGISSGLMQSISAFSEVCYVQMPKLLHSVYVPGISQELRPLVVEHFPW